MCQVLAQHLRIKAIVGEEILANETRVHFDRSEAVNDLMHDGIAIGIEPASVDAAIVRVSAHDRPNDSPVSAEGRGDTNPLYGRTSAPFEDAFEKMPAEPQVRTATRKKSAGRGTPRDPDRLALLDR